MFKHKSDIDKYFKDKWTATDIQYDGAKFNVPKSNKWISLKLLPYDREIIGYGGIKTRRADYANLQVLCYDTSATLCYNLASEVQKFLECKDITAVDGALLHIDLGIGDGNGAIPLDNGIYETMISFKVTNYEG